MSSQKQNREGVVEAQSGQYRASAESSPGCGGGPGRDVTRGCWASHTANLRFDTIKKVKNSL